MQVKFMHMRLYVLLVSEAKSFLQVQLIIVHFKRVGSIKENNSVTPAPQNLGQKSNPISTGNSSGNTT